MLFLIISLLVGAGFAFICAYMAKNRGRNPKIWGLLGLFFAIFAVIALAIIGDAPPSEMNIPAEDEKTA